MSGDLFQHRINNPTDWDDYWYLSDPRINILGCSDNEYLQFLAETLHPLIRSNSDEVNQLLIIYNEYLKSDGYQIVIDHVISGKGIYKGIAQAQIRNTVTVDIHKSVAFLDSKYLLSQLEAIKITLQSSPEQSIGMCKEIIESYCKAILNDNNITETGKLDFMELVSKANEYMHLVPANVSEQVKGEKLIKSILTSLNNIVQKMDELRNIYGTGHGKDKNYVGLQKRHAELVVNITYSTVIFWSDTYQTKRTNSMQSETT